MAIENARLYREATEKARLEQELRIAAAIQQAPDAARRARRARSSSVAGTTVPCRAIGGDFFDYLELGAAAVGFALGDVSGKGAPAALLTAVVQGMFTVEADSDGRPGRRRSRTINRGLKRRNVESKFVTMFYGVLSADGTLVLLQRRAQRAGAAAAGRRRAPRDGRHDPRHVRLRDLRSGDARSSSRATRSWSSATACRRRRTSTGEEYGDDRLIECLEANRGASPAAMRDGADRGVREFCAGGALRATT